MGPEVKKWEIYPYRQYVSELQSRLRLIYAGQVIRLKHAESGGYVCVDDEGRIPTTNEPQAYLRIYNGSQTGENSDEQTSTNSLFEVEIAGDQEHGQPLVWEDQKTKKPSVYRFRHLNSGRVLTVKSFSKNGKDVMVLTTS